MKRPPIPRADLRTVETGWVALDREFPEAELAARRFWERLEGAGGTLITIGSEAHREDRIEGEPTMRRADDGSLFAIEGVADVSVAGALWRVTLSSDYEGGLRVRARIPRDAVERAESILAFPTRVSIEAKRVSGEGVKRLFRELRVRADERGVRVSARRTADAVPRFSLDDDGDLVPEDLLASARVDGAELRIEVQSFCGMSVRVECDTDRQDLARGLLASMEPAPAKKRRVRSVGREIDVAGYGWERVGGLEALKAELEECVEAPLRNPELFRRLGLGAPKGVLLAGPPGTGKTLLAKVLACRSNAAFLYATPGDIFSMWFGESERALHRLFAEARRCADREGRAIIFLDEVESLFAARSDDSHEGSRRVMAQLLTEMDGLEERPGVLVLAATNRVGDLDPALLRPGRFDRVVEVPLPDARARRAILELHLAGKPCGPIDATALADIAGGFSGADLEQTVARATFAAARREAAVTGDDLAALAPDAIARVRVSHDDLSDAVRDLRSRIPAWSPDTVRTASGKLDG